jgi:hypothetical protein
MDGAFCDRLSMGEATNPERNECRIERASAPPKGRRAMQVQRREVILVLILPTIEIIAIN